MAPRQKRLLLTVDGSARALETVRYAGEEEAFKNMKIVLFHVFNSIPDAYYDLEKEPKSVKVVRHVRGWEAEQKKKIRNYMEDARQLLIDAGHPETAVEIKIQNRKKGVARDIIIETPLYRAIINEQGGGFKSFVLNDYQRELDGESGLMELVQTELPAELPGIWV